MLEKEVQKILHTPKEQERILKEKREIIDRLPEPLRELSISYWNRAYPDNPIQ